MHRSHLTRPVAGKKFPGATWRPDETYRRLTSVRLETVSLVQTSEDRRPDATSGEKRPGVSSHGVPLHSSASDEADVSAPSADCSEDAEKAVDDCEDPPQERHLAKTSDELGRLRLVGDPAGRLACLAHGSAGYRTLPPVIFDNRPRRLKGLGAVTTYMVAT